MAMVYQWREGFHNHGVDATRVRRELDAIERINKRVTPELTVDWAKNKEAAMHAIIFDKTDKDAAYEHRLSVARSMIAAVVRVRTSAKVTSPGRPKEKVIVREFPYVPKDPDGDGGGHYQSYDVVLKTPRSRKLVLLGLWQDLQSWRNRARDYEEFAAVVHAIEQNESAIQQRIA